MHLHISINYIMVKNRTWTCGFLWDIKGQTHTFFFCFDSEKNLHKFQEIIDCKKSISHISNDVRPSINVQICIFSILFHFFWYVWKINYVIADHCNNNLFSMSPPTTMMPTCLHAHSVKCTYCDVY